MDIAHRLHRLEFFESLSARVRSLSRRLGQGSLAKRLIPLRRRAGGVMLLVFALASGIWARDAALAEATRSWLEAHPPSERIWRHALESRGYRPASEARLAHKAARTLPSLAEVRDAIWMTEDANWIALFVPAEDRLDPMFYCFSCAQAPAGWVPRGRGWEAFDPVLERMDDAASRRKPAARPRAEAMDPYELRY